VAEGEQVGDVRLEASWGYDREVEWAFSFTVTT
jgi:hypothetical protein